MSLSEATGIICVGLNPKALTKAAFFTRGSPQLTEAGHLIHRKLCATFLPAVQNNGIRSAAGQSQLLQFEVSRTVIASVSPS